MMRLSGWIRPLALAALLVAAATPARAQGPAAAAEAEVRKVIADYNAAYEKNDLDTYFKAFAPDLTQWFPSGRVDLPSYRADWTKTIAVGQPQRKGGGPRPPRAAEPVGRRRRRHLHPAGDLPQREGRGEHGRQPGDRRALQAQRHVDHRPRQLRPAKNQP